MMATLLAKYSLKPVVHNHNSPMENVATLNRDLRKWQDCITDKLPSGRDIIVGISTVV